MSAKKKAVENPPSAQTVKLPHELFVRLKLYGAETRRSNQDILLAALEEYLNRRRSGATA
jgi:predicted transcriptional regulator